MPYQIQTFGSASGNQSVEGSPDVRFLSGGTETRVLTIEANQIVRQPVSGFEQLGIPSSDLDWIDGVPYLKVLPAAGNPEE